jgi:hypothetical protein
MADPNPGWHYPRGTRHIPACSKGKLSPPANDVSFSISTERHSYKAGEQFTLNYRVTNISNKPLYVPSPLSHIRPVRNSVTKIHWTNHTRDVGIAQANS